MKKLLALIVALMMALTCVSAFADTVYTKLTVDGDALKGVLTGFGMPEDQMGMVDPIVSLVNALGVNVVTVDDGAQIDLDLNGAAALSLGFAANDAGASVVSTLFPNYILTISNETIDQMMSQFMSNMPGAGEGGEGGMDFTAMGEVFGGYYQKYFEACAAAGQPGDPVTGEYEFEGQTFDTMIPVTVDMDAIKQATVELMDELMADPAAMAMIKGYAQGFAQNTGAEFDEANFEAEFKAGFEEWLAHFPETASAEIYVNSAEEDGKFYMIAQSTKAGAEAADFTCYMLFIDDQNMTMGFSMDMGEEGTMEAGFTLQGSDMRMDFSMAGMYFGLGLSFQENQFGCDLYFMDAEKPLVTVSVITTQGGERTLPVDAEGKTELAIEEIMANGNSEAAQGLYGDVMANGLGALMGTLSEQVPEVSAMLGAIMGGGAAMAG